MATLVLSTVGTVLGGPVGGAIGSLIGGAIDSQVFGPGPRHGPRLGDLSIQTSSYGSAIPRIHGSMRVAGSVVWATDLKEGETVAGGGKSGPEVVSYVYSASFAVALSSRPAKRIGRIWADSKLLRGVAGDLKTRAKLRFYAGSEDQAIDPLIASVEGAGKASAFRGLTLAVFEDLALVDYGNRIPVITFELIADEGTVTVAEIVSDVTRGDIAPISGGAVVGGFAAHGEDRRSAIAELLDLTGTEIVEDDGAVAVMGAAAPVILGTKEMRSCVADGERAKAADAESRHQISARTLPRSLALTYYDPARDYQAGQARAVIAGGGRTEWRADSPVVLAAVEAKRIANTAMARRWAERDRMTLRLDPSFALLTPGTPVELEDVAGRWIVDAVTIEQMVVIAELRRQPSGGTLLPADSGRAVREPDLVTGTTEIALIDAPDLGFGDGGTVSVKLAASSAGGFRAVPVTISVNGQPHSSVSVLRRAVMGQAASVLGAASAELIDLANSVDVVLIASDQLLLNADDDALAMGANTLLIGNELIQFGRAAELIPGSYRLSRLLRGRRGTDWAMASHALGEPVILLDRATIIDVPLDGAALGAVITASAHGMADDPVSSPMASVTLGGESRRPLSPAHLTATPLSGGAIRIDWQPRSIAGLAWVDGASDPSLSERRFAVAVDSASGHWAAEVTGGATLTIDAAAAAPLGHGAATIAVSERATAGSSRATLLSTTI